MARCKSCPGFLSLLMILILAIGCAAKVEESPVSSSPESASPSVAAPDGDADSQSQDPVFKDGFESGKTEEWSGQADEEELAEDGSGAAGEGG